MKTIKKTWGSEEDKKLVDLIAKYGYSNWLVK